MSLRLRLALFGAAVVALTLVLFGALLYSLLARGVNTNQDDALRSRALDAVVALDSSSPSGLIPRRPLLPANLRTSTDVFVEVVASDGSVIYTTGELNGAAPAASPDLLSQAVRNNGAFGTTGDAGRGTGLRLYAIPFASGYVLTGQSTSVPRSGLSGVVGFLVISGIPTLLAALVASWLVAGRALKPLKQVAGAADEIGRERDFSRRLPERLSRDEVALLALSFNRMLDQLQDAYGVVSASLYAQRRFVADASHELRTPLTTIQGNAGLLAHGPHVAGEVRQAAAADIAEESARMSRLVDRMLTLARADSGLRLELAPVDLRTVVVEVCRQAAAIHPGAEIRADAAEATVAGDEDALRQLLWILLDNAARYAQTRISVELRDESGWARLTVADDGPGIAPEDRERVFERFFRADRSRAGHGSGLGLSIARWTADQHGGRIVAGQDASGGAALYVDLPLLRTS
jgi:two-component system, OmpR family, sensor kinase